MIMTAPTIVDYLKYANLQMAAEAFIYDETTKNIKTATTKGVSFTFFSEQPCHVARALN